MSTSEAKLRIASLSNDQIEFYFSKLSSVNQVSKRDKIRFWNECIKSFLKSGRDGRTLQRFTFSPAELASEFTFGPLNHAPTCIPQILAVLLEESSIQDASAFTAKSTIPSAIIGTVFSAIKGLFSTGTGSLSSTEDLAALEASLPATLLHTEVLEDTCSIFIKYIKAKNIPLLMDHQDFMLFLKDALGIDHIDDQDVSLLLKELSRQNKLLIRTGNADSENAYSASNSAYKFHLDSATPIVPISEVDMGYLTLKRTRHSLTSQIEEMDSNIKRLQKDIKKALLEKEKPKAMLNLKRVKRLNTIVEKRSNSLLTIEDILEKIESAQTEEKILQAYSVGASALKTILAKTSIDKVHNTLDDLADLLADHREIEQAMADGQESVLLSTSNAAILDEQDLERELDELLEMERKAHVQSTEDGQVDQLAETLQNLPSISSPLILPSSAPLANAQSTEKKQNDRVAVEMRMVRVISEKERESNRQDWLNQLAQQTQENQSRKERDRLEKRRQSPSPSRTTGEPIEPIKTGRDSQHHQSIRVNIISPHPASIQSGRTSRIEAYSHNQSPQPFSDFFWEARLAGANRDRVALHASPVPSQTSQVANQRHQSTHQSQEQDINSVRYTRVKTDLRDDDPDADLKMQANRQWKESIERQIDEKRKRDMMEKQRDQLEENMRIAKALREEETYVPSSLPYLKSKQKDPPPVDLGPVPDMQYTQKAYSITQDQMREHTRIPRFKKELFHPSPQKEEATALTPLPKIAPPSNPSPQKNALRKALRPPQPPPQKSIADRRLEQEMLGLIPGSHSHQPRYYIPKRPKQAPASSVSAEPASRTIVVNEKIVLPSIAPSENKTSAAATHPPKLTTSDIPTSSLSPSVLSAAKSPTLSLDPRSPNKTHQRIVRGGTQVNEMEKLKAENLQQLSHLKKILDMKKQQYAAS